jgi:hypothetical protein
MAPVVFQAASGASAAAGSSVSLLGSLEPTAPLTIAPKKINWDLKRDVEKRLQKLERQTQGAIRELVRTCPTTLSPTTIAPPSRLKHCRHRRPVQCHPFAPVLSLVYRGLWCPIPLSRLHCCNVGCGIMAGQAGKSRRRRPRATQTSIRTSRSNLVKPFTSRTNSSGVAKRVILRCRRSHTHRLCRWREERGAVFDYVALFCEVTTIRMGFAQCRHRWVVVVK